MKNDLIYRDGGPIFYKHFSCNLNIERNGRKKDRSDLNIEDGLDARYAIEKSDMRPGDVMFLSSVSGRTASVVDLAWVAKEFGINVIALTSMVYARTIDAVHPSGKRLYEFP